MEIKGKKVLILSAILPLVLCAGDLAAQEGVVQVVTAQSVYDEILSGLNDEEAFHLTNAKKKSEPIIEINNSDAEAKEFVEEIRFEIKESVVFPETLKGKGYQAVVLVEFQIDAFGRLKGLKATIQKGLRFPEFEEWAKKAVIQAARFFPTIPPEMNLENLKFKIPIIFEEA